MATGNPTPLDDDAGTYASDAASRLDRAASELSAVTTALCTIHRLATIAIKGA